MKGAFLLEEIKRGITVIKKIKNWPDFFLDYLGLTEKKLLILKMKDGFKYIIRTKTSDKYLFVETVLEDQYHTKQINFKDSIIIDLGPQIGLFSVFVSKKAKKVFAFEPVQENFELLKKNIELNKLENKIFPFNLAVSDKKGKEKIFLSENHSGGHSIYGFKKFDEKKSSPINLFLQSKGFNEKKFVEVSSVTLDEIFKINKINHCDLLKMDIEGAEYNVFYTLSDSCFKKIHKIAMEVHDIDENKNNCVYLIKFLESKGFKVKYRKAVLFAERK